jgi:hypothetical protein
MSLNHLPSRSHWQRIRWRCTSSVYLPLAAGTLCLVLVCGIASAATLSSDSMQSSEERINKAREECEDGVDAADAGRWEEAEFRWLKAAAIDPHSACGLNNLAVRHEREGEFDEAGEAYRRALEHAEGDMRSVVLTNWDNFLGGQLADRELEDAEEAGEFSGEIPPIGLAVTTYEITVSVPLAEGRYLADFERVLVGNFIITANDTGMDLNDMAVRYFRRRIVQRTFYQTVDLLGEPFNPMDPDPIHNAEMWVARAAAADADVIFAGRVGVTTSDESRLVTERIKTPSGEVTEVARFREMTGYHLSMDFFLLNGEDGSILIDVTGLEGEREFAADEGVSAGDAVVETLEELLPQVVDAVTPARREQTRLLVY